jgi:ADP-ribose pyrophosphatase YjhB (NUDIX family)
LDSPCCTVHKLIADVAVFAGERVLLVRYLDPNKYDHQPGWFLPDDLIAHLEHPDVAARRILSEQIGLTEVSPRLNHVESFPGRDRTWHLVFHYRADVPEVPVGSRSSDVAAHDWFLLDALPERSEVAHHGWALDILRALAPQPLTSGT